MIRSIGSLITIVLLTHLISLKHNIIISQTMSLRLLSVQKSVPLNSIDFLLLALFLVSNFTQRIECYLNLNYYTATHTRARARKSVYILYTIRDMYYE